MLKKVDPKDLRKKLDSKEEQDFTKWSVELGRKINKEAYKRLLSELSAKKRSELLK